MDGCVNGTQARWYYGAGRGGDAKVSPLPPPSPPLPSSSTLLGAFTTLGTGHVSTPEA